MHLERHEGVHPELEKSLINRKRRLSAEHTCCTRMDNLAEDGDASVCRRILHHQQDIEDTGIPPSNDLESGLSPRRGTPMC